MNVTRYLKNRKDKTSRQIVFEGERLDMQAVWKLRDRFWPPRRGMGGVQQRHRPRRNVQLGDGGCLKQTNRCAPKGARALMPGPGARRGAV